MSRARESFGSVLSVCYDGVMSPDDPDLLICTCVHRALRSDERIDFLCPDGTIFTVAKDCPVHGMVLHPKEEKSSEPLDA